MKLTKQTKKQDRGHRLRRLPLMLVLSYALVILGLTLFPVGLGEAHWLFTGITYCPTWGLIAFPSFAAALCLKFKKRREALAFFLGLGLTLFGMIGFRVPLPGMTDEIQSPGFRLVSWNIKGEEIPTESLINSITSLKGDIVLLQECVTRAEDLRMNLPGYEVHFDPGDDVAILSRYKIIKSSSVELSNRGLYTLIDTPLGELNVYSVHFHKGQRHPRLKFLPAIRTTFRLHKAYREDIQNSVPRTNCILGGDFNAPSSSPLIRGLDLKDTFRESGKGLDLSYPTVFPLWKVDHIFISHDLRCRKAEVGDNPLSDHLPIVMQIEKNPEHQEN